MRSAAPVLTLNELLEHLQQLADPDIAAHSQRFFKSGEGEYGEGDQFLGIRVPVLRKLVKSCRQLTDAELVDLLQSNWHEQRLLAVLVLVDRFERGGFEQQESTVSLYLDNLDSVNNWDLVDSSAHKILGPWLYKRDRALLYQLLESGELWRKRVAIMTSLHFIKQDDYADTLRMAEILLQDSHDLIQKAVGWMLREVGNRSRETETQFLKKFYSKMPRTMLRYAIEKYPEAERRAFIEGRA